MIKKNVLVKRLHERLSLQLAMSFYSKQGGRLQGALFVVESLISMVLCGSRSFLTSNFILVSMVPAYFCEQFENSVQTHHWRNLRVLLTQNSVDTG